MKQSVTVAQTRVSWDVRANVEAMAAILAVTPSDEVVLFPEGAVSGYDDELSGIERLDPAALAAAIDGLAALASERRIHLICGSLLKEHGAWYNAALYLAPDGTRQIYRKVNLATHERGRLAAGSELPLFSLRSDGGTLSVGVQLCREILFPEQWRHLAAAGAQAILYLTNAANPAIPAGVWRSHLISHAAASQRFVISANIADACQHCPSAVISPRGEVRAELSGDAPGLLRAVIDTDEVADWYLGQRREDVVRIGYLGDARTAQ